MASMDYTEEIIEDDEMRSILADLSTRASDPHSAREWRRILKMLTKIGSPTEKLLDMLAEHLLFGTSYPVSFDYDRIVEDSIRGGHYGEQRLDILLKKFPKRREGVHKVNLMLFRPWRSCETRELTVIFHERSLRPADIYELIALLENYPDLQSAFPIAALDSTKGCDDGACVLFLTGDSVYPGRSRGLERYHDAGPWSDKFCFAVALKE